MKCFLMGLLVLNFTLLALIIGGVLSSLRGRGKRYPSTTVKDVSVDIEKNEKSTDNR